MRIDYVMGPIQRNSRSLTSVLQLFFFRKYLISLPQKVIEKDYAPDVDLSYSMACARTCLVHEAFVTKE